MRNMPTLERMGDFFEARLDGYFILTDYFAPTDADEATLRQELLRLRREQSLADAEYYHYDTPLTVAHETEALLSGGFASVEVLGCRGATACLIARR